MLGVCVNCTISCVHLATFSTIGAASPAVKQRLMMDNFTNSESSPVPFYYTYYNGVISRLDVPSAGTSSETIARITNRYLMLKNDRHIV